MAGESPSPSLQSSSASASSASQPQHILAMPAASPPSTLNSAAPGAGLPQQQQQNPQGHPQSSHQTAPSGAGPSGNHMSLQSLHPQPPSSAGQLHAVNLSQGQAFGQSQLAQMNFQQIQQQKQAGATRPQHAQYAQNQLSAGNMQAQGLSQQAASPAMVQSTPGNYANPRTSSAQRLMQVPQGASRAPQFGPTISSVGGTPSLQQQQQMAQRAGAGSSSARPLYATQYSQHLQQQQQMGALARPAMGGQATGHPSMLPVQGSQQLQSQFTSQQMQGRQKQGQVQSSQFSASATAGSQIPIGMMGSITSMGGQMVRQSSSATQQQQRGQQTQTRAQQLQQPQQQQQHQMAQQQQSLSSPQKLQGQQIQRVPSVSSIGSGLQSSAQSPVGSSSLPNQSQQPWMQKQMHQQSLTASAPYQVFQQQAAQQKQAQAQHSQQLQVQPQPTQLSQQQQLGRVLPSAVQRPSTPTGVQPGTPRLGTPTTSGGTMSQPSESGNRILGKRSIQELVAQVDPLERLDPEVEDILLEIADDFVESVTTFACKLAKHRKSNILEAKDVLLHLNRNWDLNIPGFGGEEYRAYKRMESTRPFPSSQKSLLSPQ